MDDFPYEALLNGSVVRYTIRKQQIILQAECAAASADTPGMRIEFQRASHTKLYLRQLARGAKGSRRV